MLRAHGLAHSGAKFIEYPGNITLPCLTTWMSCFPTSTNSSPVNDRSTPSIASWQRCSSSISPRPRTRRGHGDTAWRNVLNSYYAVVRKELARYRGKETNTTRWLSRDLRWPRASSALRARGDTRGAPTRDRGPSRSAYGECELMGDNIGGIAVHAGARIMAKAEPGTVMFHGR